MQDCSRAHPLQVLYSYDYSLCAPDGFDGRQINAKDERPQRHGLCRDLHPSSRRRAQVQQRAAIGQKVVLFIELNELEGCTRAEAAWANKVVWEHAQHRLAAAAPACCLHSYCACSWPSYCRHDPMYRSETITSLTPAPLLGDNTYPAGACPCSSLPWRRPPARALRGLAARFTHRKVTI